MTLHCFEKTADGYRFVEPETGIEWTFSESETIEPTPHRVQLWLAMCKSLDVRTRFRGLQALRRAGTLFRETVEMATETMRAEAQERRRGGRPKAALDDRRGMVESLLASLSAEDDLSGTEIVRALRDARDRSAVKDLANLLDEVREGEQETPEKARYALVIIEALISLGAGRYGDLLLSYLEHRDDATRSMALAILRERGGSYARPALRTILRSDRPLRSRLVAAEALLALGSDVDEAFATVEGAASSCDPSLRRQAVPTLALRRRSGDLKRLRKIWTQEPRLEDRLFQGMILYERDILSAEELFAEALAHPYPHIRLIASRLLASSPREEGRTLLDKAQKEEPDPFILEEGRRRAPDRS